MGISCDWLWFHSWMELGFTSCRVSISVQGLSASSPIGCKTPTPHSGVLPREAAGGCAHPGNANSEGALVLSAPSMLVFHFFFPDCVSNHNLNILSASVPKRVINERTAAVPTVTKLM